MDLIFIENNTMVRFYLNLKNTINGFVARQDGEAQISSKHMTVEQIFFYSKKMKNMYLVRVSAYMCFEPIVRILYKRINEDV